MVAILAVDKKIGRVLKLLWGLKYMQAHRGESIQSTIVNLNRLLNEEIFDKNKDEDEEASNLFDILWDKLGMEAPSFQSLEELDQYYTVTIMPFINNNQPNENILKAMTIFYHVLAKQKYIMDGYFSCAHLFSHFNLNNSYFNSLDYLYNTDGAIKTIPTHFSSTIHTCVAITNLLLTENNAQSQLDFHTAIEDPIVQCLKNALLQKYESIDEKKSELSKILKPFFAQCGQQLQNLKNDQEAILSQYNTLSPIVAENLLIKTYILLPHFKLTIDQFEKASVGLISVCQPQSSLSYLYGIANYYWGGESFLNKLYALMAEHRKIQQHHSEKIEQLFKFIDQQTIIHIENVLKRYKELQQLKPSVEKLYTELSAYLGTAKNVFSFFCEQLEKNKEDSSIEQNKMIHETQSANSTSYASYLLSWIKVPSLLSRATPETNEVIKFKN